MLRALFSRRPEKVDTAHSLYESAVLAARQDAFYTALGVPDSIDGRFELVSLHVYLVQRRLRQIGQAADSLGQTLAETFFADMDINLREMGVSDIGVGRRVKRMIEGHYGRVTAYDKALAAADDGALRTTLERNLFGTTEVSSTAVDCLCRYIRDAAEGLDRCGWAEMQEGRVRYPALAAYLQDGGSAA